MTGARTTKKTGRSPVAVEVADAGSLTHDVLVKLRARGADLGD